MTEEEYTARFLAIERHAAMLRGHEIALRTHNGGRYWHIGAIVGAWKAAPAIAAIDAWEAEQLDALDREFDAAANQ